MVKCIAYYFSGSDCKIQGGENQTLKLAQNQSKKWPKTKGNSIILGEVVQNFSFGHLIFNPYI